MVHLGLYILFNAYSQCKKLLLTTADPVINMIVLRFVDRRILQGVVNGGAMTTLYRPQGLGSGGRSHPGCAST
jgi:hypothetical protein